tara:strand:+ start:309 stop:671 length:363 start_codon:yes stop_codon:yes gene_type:complete
MNKDLPIIIKNIFETPDQTIWQGDWLRILNLLLNDANLTVFWNELLHNIQNNHSSRFSSLTLNKYIKWEVKGFIAQVIKNKINNVQEEKFLDSLVVYLNKKKIKIEHKQISKVVSSVYEN